MSMISFINILPHIFRSRQSYAQQFWFLWYEFVCSDKKYRKLVCVAGWAQTNRYFNTTNLNKLIRLVLSNMKYRERVFTSHNTVIMTLRSWNYVKCWWAPDDGRETSPAAHPDQFGAARSRHRHGHLDRGPATRCQGALASINPFIIFIFHVRTRKTADFRDY